MIEVEGLVKNYGATKAVQGITFTIPKGELFCFLGPNGAGKTTTIKMLCGLLRPTHGTIRVAGIDLRDDPRAVRKITGYIPDLPYLYDLLSILEFLDFTGELYQIPPGRFREERDRYLELFDLQAHRHSLIRDLSHGMRQRVVYASTLLQEPQVMFVDEPFVGLDPHSIRLIQRLLKEQTEKGVTIFLTTHILALAEAMADRIGIIADGRMVAFGTLAEIRSRHEKAGSLEDLFLSLTD